MSSFNMVKKKKMNLPHQYRQVEGTGGKNLLLEEKVQLLDWITKPKFSGNDTKKLFKFIAI